MKRIFLLILMICTVLTGCDSGAKKMSISEVKIDDVSNKVREFINGVTLDEDETGSGIYMYNDTKTRRYIYLSQEFLDNGRDFGSAEINGVEDTINIVLSDKVADEEDSTAYKLYEIKLYKNYDETYEYIKVFKNEEETYFQTLGI